MVVACTMALVLASCDAQYRKTKSGFAYKIIKSSNKDSLIKTNNVVKFDVIWKFKDSILFDSHGKLPQYAVASDRLKGSYSYLEILPQMKKGDSAVIIQVADTLFKKGYQQQFPFAKKGDRINIYLKILDVFKDESTGRADAEKEYEKVRPQMEKEAREAMAKQQEKEEKELQAYFAAKKITAEKAPQGTFVVINEKGSGTPATSGKFVAVKYDGRLLKNEEQFDAGVYVFQLGLGNAIQGWHDGLQLFNKGGKGVLYVPGTLGYGAQGNGAIGPNEALKFDVEILEVSDTQEKADAVKKLADSLGAKKPVQR